MVATNETAIVINVTEGAANATNATEGGAANATNATEGGAANATNATAENQTFWLPIYDGEDWTKEMVVVNLTERGIYPDFELWYMTFFGNNGIVVMDKQGQNQTAANQTEGGLGGAQNMTSALAGGATEVPAGMENIVAWIIVQLNMKMAQLNIPQYFNASGVNISGGAGGLPTPSGGAAAAVVGIVAPASLFNQSEYVASSTCQLQGGSQGENAANDTLCCNNQAIGTNGTQFC